MVFAYEQHLSLKDLKAYCRPRGLMEQLCTTDYHPLLQLRQEQHKTTALIRNVVSAQDSILPQSLLNQ